MNVGTTVAPAAGRRPLATLGKLTLAAMLGIGVALILNSLILNGTVDAFTLVPAALTVALAALVATGWRWAPAVAAVVGGLLVMTVAFFALPTLSRPQEPDFPITVLMLALALVATLAGVAATVQNYRDGEWRTPGWLSSALIGFAGLVLGAILVGIFSQPWTAAGVSPETLAGLPYVKSEDFAFGPSTIQVKAGAMVALRLVNEDSTAHTFDVDELGVHAPMPGGQSAVALFEATTPGTYKFYCAIPGHANVAEGTGMIGTLIVEPAG